MNVFDLMRMIAMGGGAILFAVAVIGAVIRNREMGREDYF
jgi:hypothetical protein